MQNGGEAAANKLGGKKKSPSSPGRKGDPEVLGAAEKLESTKEKKQRGKRERNAGPSLRREDRNILDKT